MVAALVQGLAELGHRVSLLAPAQTNLAGATCIAVPEKTLLGPMPALMAYLPSGVDVVHGHYSIARPPDTVPFLQTLHGNHRSGDSPPPHTVCLSFDHARRHGVTSFVYNGLDPNSFTFQSKKDDYDLFLGRLHSIKGYRWAIEGAKRTKRRLLLAGGWRPSLSRYVRYVGGVGGEKKAALLAGALTIGANLHERAPSDPTAGDRGRSAPHGHAGTFTLAAADATTARINAAVHWAARHRTRMPDLPSTGPAAGSCGSRRKARRSRSPTRSAI